MSVVRWVLPLPAGMGAGLATALLTRREHFVCVRPATASTQQLRCPQAAWANWDLVVLASIAAAFAVLVVLLLRRGRGG